MPTFGRAPSDDHPVGSPNPCEGTRGCALAPNRLRMSGYPAGVGQAYGKKDHESTEEASPGYAVGRAGYGT